jgi:excisionase family DNA binding protein
MLAAKNSRLTMKEAAEYLGRSYSWIFSNHRSIGLGGYRIGGHWFFDLEELQVWESNLERHGSPRELAKTKSKLKRQDIQFI